MNGPAAPKDPEKKRPYFYIMKDKEIFGAKQEDGSAIHFIYESDGRLINSAQIVGNITDENMLRLLETVEGFGKLVHSIGVSVETDNPKEEMEFIFQMYGKKDLYGGGTNLRCSLTGDGMERRIYLSDYTWTDQVHHERTGKDRKSQRSVLSERRIYGSGRGGRRSGGYEIGTVLHDDRAFSHESGQHLPYPQSDREGESRKRSNACLYRRFDHAGGGSNTDQYRVLCL